MRWPLGRQIFLPMVGVVLATVAIVSALNAWLASSRVQAQHERQLAAVVQTFSASNFPLESNVLHQAGGLTGVEFVVTSLSGDLLAASNPRLIRLVAPDDVNFADVNKLLVSADSDRSFLRRVVTIDRRPVGGTRQLLHVFYPEEHWRDAYIQAIWPPLAIGAGAMLLVALAAMAIARQVTRPVARLRSQVQRIAEGKFQAMPVPAREDEIRELAVAVNLMAAQLTRYEGEARHSERLKTLGTLGGGIAHQVRNAATGCRLAIDLHARDCPSATSSNGTGDEPLVVAARQLALIESHIQRLLALGKPASGGLATVDLAEVEREALALVQPTAVHLGVRIESQLPNERLTIRGQAEALVQMLVNLLVNAVEAAAKVQVGAGQAALGTGVAKVSLGLSRLSQVQAELVVADTGAGPDAAIQEQLFQPFATDKPGGTGLGLAVARQIAEDHGGRIHWERRGDWTRFCVQLPLEENNNGERGASAPR